MRLTEWAATNGERVEFLAGAARVDDRTTFSAESIARLGADHCGRTPTAAWHLYHLADYAVSSVAAGAVWLCPRD
jgi:hypothetical protein